MQPLHGSRTAYWLGFKSTLITSKWYCIATATAHRNLWVLNALNGLHPVDEIAAKKKEIFTKKQQKGI